MNETEKSLFFLLFQQFRLARIFTMISNYAGGTPALPD